MGYLVLVLEQAEDQVALDQVVLECFLVAVGLEEQDMGLVVMGLVDMDLELVTDQVEAMVQDRVQDMEQAMELDQNLLNTVKVEQVLVGYLEVEQDKAMVQPDLKLRSMENLVE